MAKKSVFCLVRDEGEACRIVDELKMAGFMNNDISALLPDKSSTREFAHQKATKAPEGAVTGAGTGGVLGGALGWLVGIGALAIPGLGPFVAAGPLMAALSGAAVHEASTTPGSRRRTHRQRQPALLVSSPYLSVCILKDIRMPMHFRAPIAMSSGAGR